MKLNFLTPDVWNGLVLAVVAVGGALAALRLYSDLSRPSRRSKTDEDENNQTQLR